MDVSRLTMSSFIKLVLKDNIKFTIILNIKFTIILSLRSSLEQMGTVQQRKRERSRPNFVRS